MSKIIFVSFFCFVTYLTIDFLAQSFFPMGPSEEILLELDSGVNLDGGISSSHLSNIISTSITRSDKRKGLNEKVVRY